MSAFIAVFNLDGWSIDSSVLVPMMQRIKYRGPDAQDVWINGPVAFGHTLSRVMRESEKEHQPLTIEAVTIVGYVRLDDRSTLVNKLQAKSAPVDTSFPDVELVLHAYLIYGEASLDHIAGDFVFVLWDESNQKLLAARDQIGVHSLYYAYVENTVVISTELTAIRLHPIVSSKLDEQAVADFLLIGRPNPTEKDPTIFADIRRLPPAHKLSIKRNESPQVTRYWTLSNDLQMIHYKSEQEYVTHFNHLLEQSIKDRLRADRTVISMSGGIDSTSLAAIILRLLNKGEIHTDVQAITNVYDRIHPDTEAAYANLASLKLGIPVNYFVCDSFGIKEPLKAFAEPKQAYDSKYDESYSFVTRFGSLIVYGEPLDNILAYEPFSTRLKRMPLKEAIKLYVWTWKFMSRRPYLKLRSYLNPKNWGKKNIKPSYSYPTWLNPDFEKRLNTRERWKEIWNTYEKNLHPIHNLSYIGITELEWTTHTETIEIPQFSPVQVIMPFADLRLINFALALPPEPFCKDKYILKQAMKDELPSQILNRPKTPLGKDYFNNLLAQPNAKWVDSWVATEGLEKYILRSKVQPVRGDGLDPKHVFIHLRALAFNSWLDQAINGFYQPSR